MTGAIKSFVNVEQITELANQRILRELPTAKDFAPLKPNDYMNQLFKTGERVIVTQTNGKRVIRTVRHADERQDGFVDCASAKSTGHYFFHHDGSRVLGDASERIDHATEAQLADLQALIDAEARTEQAERDRIAADPKTPFVSRFRNGDWEKWESLTLDQLQTIGAWLDATRDNQITTKFDE